MMNKTVKILPPKMPNFYRIDDGKVGKKQDGLIPKNCYPIESLTEDEAEEYGQMMKDEFLKHWNKKNNLV